MDIYVPGTADGPDVFEEEFIKRHDALNLTATAGSGSYWSDGDGRADAIRHDDLTFALEAKTRWSDRHVNAKPKASEWRKAMGEKGEVSRKRARGQLKKFDASAIRLFAVYYDAERTYAVSVPVNDYEMLVEVLGQQHLGDGPAFGRRETIQSKGHTYPYIFLPYTDWKALYEHIAEDADEPDLTNIF